MLARMLLNIQPWRKVFTKQDKPYSQSEERSLQWLQLCYKSMLIINCGSQANRLGTLATWRLTRGFLKSTYREGKKWANVIDVYTSLFQKGLSAAAPMLQDLGAGEALGSGVGALQSYDTVGEQVMDVDERGREHVGRIARAIT